MMQSAAYLYDGHSQGTLVHPLVGVAATASIVLILRLPRKLVIVPLLLDIFLTPKGQQLVVAGVHLNVYRIILLAALARWIMLRRTDPLPRRLNSIDRAVAWCAIWLCIGYTVHQGDAQALVKAVGDLLDTLAGYFVLRFLIRDREDMRRAIRVFALIAVILGAEMLNEQRTGENFFGHLGGTIYNPEVRNGKIRSHGSFRHAIPAGAYGATLIPLLLWLWSDRKSRKIVVLGVAGATAMAVTCHSSTNLGCYAAGLFALCLWPLRRQTRMMRYGIALSLVFLHLTMKGPVWSILEHVDLTGSSESFHRYELVDTLIKHFGQWWLAGTNQNGSWGWEMADTSNEYVAYGVAGGLIPLCLFIVMISRSFSGLGSTRRIVDGDRTEEWIRWCLGAALFAYVMDFFGIDMFDQLQFSWLALIAMISMTVSTTKSKRAITSRPASPPLLAEPAFK